MGIHFVLVIMRDLVTAPAFVSIVARVPSVLILRMETHVASETLEIYCTNRTGVIPQESMELRRRGIINMFPA
jgi:hypothetical protein